ncbi:hypothetical protein SB861_25470 [Paraburkholderia sp. SIMBA_049]
MADVSAAVIGFAGVLAGGYFNNFFAEDYKRFRDSQALAGALAGELQSHGEAIPLLKNMLSALHGRAKTGAELSLREMPEPGSPVFEANAEGIGKLGPGLANGVAYVYEQIRAFRVVMSMLARHHKEETPEWRTALIESGYDRIRSAEEKGAPLIEKLMTHAAESYWRRSDTRKQLGYGVVGLLAFLIVLKIFF